MLAVAESGNAPAGSSTIGGRYIMQVDTGHQFQRKRSDLQGGLENGFLSN